MKKTKKCESNNYYILLIIGIIIGVLIGGITVYYIMVKNSKPIPNEPKSKSVVESKNDTEDKDNKEDEVNIDKVLTYRELEYERLARELFNRIDYASPNCEVYPLLDNKNYKDLKQYQRLAIIEKVADEYNITPSSSDDLIHPGYHISSKIPVDIFESYYKEIFGSDKEIIYNEWSEEEDYMVIKEDDYVYEYYADQGFCDVTCYPKVLYESSEIINNDIIVYAWSYYDCKGHDEDPNGDPIIGKIKYKITFKNDGKKDSLYIGNYYWYSTELVK